jgi:hypothetical protein
MRIVVKQEWNNIQQDFVKKLTMRVKQVEQSRRPNRLCNRKIFEVMFSILPFRTIASVYALLAATISNPSEGLLWS